MLVAAHSQAFLPKQCNIDMSALQCKVSLTGNMDKDKKFMAVEEEEHADSMGAEPDCHDQDSDFDMGNERAREANMRTQDDASHDSMDLDADADFKADGEDQPASEIGQESQCEEDMAHLEAFGDRDEQVVLSMAMPCSDLSCLLPLTSTDLCTIVSLMDWKHLVLE